MLMRGYVFSGEKKILRKKKEEEGKYAGKKKRK